MAQLQIRLDPWPAEYESSFQIDEFEEEIAQVDADVEGVAWQAIEPSRQVRPETLYFVDGVRRVEARIMVDDSSGRIIRGLFGSAAVGAVRVQNNVASFEQIRVKRLLVAGGGTLLDPESFKVGNAILSFEALAVPENVPTAPMAGLQNLMRAEEANLAEELASESACVFADGPLTYLSGVMQTTVGVIKRLVQPYLSASQFQLVRLLRARQRTPLFVITKGKYDRYSWYVRVAEPRVMDHDVAGILRLEVRSGAGLERAKEMADLSASWIPSFAGEAFRDPRSPQNLLPVGALENELRHRLGDPFTIRRAIETRLFQLNQS
jgi:hypothetical protein